MGRWFGRLLALLIAPALLAPTLLTVSRHSDATMIMQSGSRTEAPALTLAQDFQNRISGPDVVWYHDFDTDAEVDQFRWTGGCQNDPNDATEPGTVTWSGTEGITPGALLLVRHAGADDGSNWWRTFSPLTGASNGRGVDDPGAGITPRVFTPTQCGSQTANWVGGYYGHASYHAANPSEFEGTEFWIQARVRYDPERVNQPDGGKTFYFTRMDQSGTDQEIVTVSGWTVEGQAYFRMYRSLSGGLLISDAGGASVSGHQPGTEYGSVGDGLCRYDAAGISDGRIANCWHWPLGEWATVLYHVVPGLDDAGDTVIQAWIAEDGETEYTKIWDMSNADLFYDVRNGISALIASAYMNGATFTQPVTTIFDQVIFSKAWVAPPQVYQ